MKNFIIVAVTIVIITLVSLIDTEIKGVECNGTIAECVRDYRIAYHDHQMRYHRQKYWDLVGQKYQSNNDFWKDSVVK
ncbi:MAG: hypothetical protein KBC53_00395 [Nitrosomonas sp.]|jgi:hypothetical protein|nr:hypothetical protein [Nitrosomonas sp.]